MTLNIPCRSNPMPYYKYVNPEPDYQNMPLTFAPMNTGGSIKLVLTNGTEYSGTPFYYRKNFSGEWLPFSTSNTSVYCDLGECVSFSGVNSTFNKNWGGNPQHAFSASVDYKAYGCLTSLTNGAPNQTNLTFNSVFSRNPGTNFTNNHIVNIRNVILANSNTNNYYDYFCGENTSLTAGVLVKISGGTNTYGSFYTNCTSLKVIEFAKDCYNDNAWNGTNAGVSVRSFYNVPNTCYCILAQGFEPSNTVLNNRFRFVYRDGKKLYYNNQQIKEDVLLNTGVIQNV